MSKAAISGQEYRVWNRAAPITADRVSTTVCFSAMRAEYTFMCRVS